MGVRGQRKEERREGGREGGMRHFDMSLTYLVFLLPFLSTVRKLRQRRDPFLTPFLPPLRGSSNNMKANICLACLALLDMDALRGGEELKEGGREGRREGGRGE